MIKRPRIEWPFTLPLVPAIQSFDWVLHYTDGTESDSYAINFPAGIYYPSDLRQAIQDNINDYAGEGATTVTMQGGHFCITNDLFRWSIKNVTSYFWQALGANPVGPTVSAWGWPLPVVAYTAAPPYTRASPLPPVATWHPGVSVLTDTREFIERPGSAVTVAQSGRGYSFSEGSLYRREVVFDYLTAAKTYNTSAEYEGAGTAERLWQDAFSRFAYYDDDADPTPSGYYYLDNDTISTFKPTRSFRTKELYRLKLGMRRIV